ncbi:unnamed protein product [Staurois parvus]|uniref:Uncharacterized protein n=1 Tax=Staurois parvus TaxID=386267 RepID=A0ABN9BBV8_9NEOB|nr:unnamed protein product [Staurois parvus]
MAEYILGLFFIFTSNDGHQRLTARLRDVGRHSHTGGNLLGVTDIPSDTGIVISANKKH